MEVKMNPSPFPYFYGQEQKLVEPTRLKKVVTSFFGTTHIGERSRHQQLMKAIQYLPPLKRASVLDAGSASGAHSFYLAKKFPDWQILGVEIEPEKEKNALKIKAAFGFSNVDFIAADLREIRHKSRFDLIFSISVLNYLADPNPVMENFSRALKPEGYLILNLPSPPKKPILPFLQKRTEEQNDPAAAGPPFFKCKGYTNAQISQMAQQAGLKTLQVYNPCGLPSQLAWELSCGVEHRPLPNTLLRPFLLALVFLDRFGESQPYPANVDCLFIGQREAVRPPRFSFLHRSIRSLISKPLLLRS
jgi:SAM-dependent methyltransferase